MSDRADGVTALARVLDDAMVVVTVAADGERDGCLVGFTTQASIEPPRFLVCLSRKNRTYRLALAAEILVVHALPESETDLADLFGGETGDEVDKFARCAHRAGPGDTPVLEQLGTWMAGSIDERIDLGDHVGFLLDPIIWAAADDRPRPMRLHQAMRIAPGHAP